MTPTDLTRYVRARRISRWSLFLDFLMPSRVRRRDAAMRIIMGEIVRDPRIEVIFPDESARDAAARKADA